MYAKGQKLLYFPREIIAEKEIWKDIITSKNHAEPVNTRGINGIEEFFTRQSWISIMVRITKLTRKKYGGSTQVKDPIRKTEEKMSCKY